jgi:pyridoxamine 5'-phosphate oxidase
MKLADLRQDYRLARLERDDLLANPIQQFEKWFQEALKAEILEANAMILATVDDHFGTDLRTVLLKDLHDGFIFFTNYQSHKGEQLAKDPRASLLFLWLPLERQIKIQGKVEKISRAASLAYFHSRPRGSQIGAWSSAQSQVIPDRSVLIEREKFYEAQFPEEVPLPDFWGGFRLVPEHFEFWQGRSNRLHDRFSYQKVDGDWRIDRLAP